MKKGKKTNHLTLQKFKVAKLNKYGKRLVKGGNGGNGDGEELTHTILPSKFCGTID